VKPREQYLIISGATLAGILVVQSLETWWGERGEMDWGVVVPAGEFAFTSLVLTTSDLTYRFAVVYFLTLFVRQQLAPVDLDELRKARYELKGA
jgi:hypothetical protein